MTDGMDSYIEAIFDDRICAEPTDPLNVYTGIMNI